LLGLIGRCVTSYESILKLLRIGLPNVELQWPMLPQSL
jgi:hypothetical protein